MDTDFAGEVGTKADGKAGSKLLADPKVLFVAAACVAFGAVMAVAPGAGFHLLGYVFACLVTFTLVTFFRRFSVEKAATEGVVPPSWTRWFSIALLVVGFAVAILNAWAVAVKFS